LPIVADASIFCGRIFPPACYFADVSFRESTSVTDCVFGWSCARIVAAAYLDLAAASALAIDVLGVGVATSFAEVVDLFPGGVIVVAGDTAFLFCTGTTNFTQLGVQAIYFGLGPIDQGQYSASNLYEAAAFHLADLLAAAGGAGLSRVVLCGHSYGAAACYVLAAKMRLANPLRAVELLTFGMPKPGDVRLTAIVDPLRQKHYVNERDPIPYVPPVPRNFIELLIVIAAGLQVQWTLFARPEEITVITHAGELVATNAAEVPDDLVRALCQAAAFATGAPAFTDHAMEWYVYRLCVACACVPRPCVAPDAVALNFNFHLDSLEFVHAAVPATESYDAALTFDPLTETWFALVAGFERVRITSAVDEFGTYSDFTVSYFFRDGPTIFVRFDWTFTPAEMFRGVASVTFPALFSLDLTDVVVSLGGLIIQPIIS